MGMDYITLGTAPVEESCAQLGTDEYSDRSIIECRIWRQQLLHTFPIPETLAGEAFYKVKSFDYESGPYREVCIVFNDSIRAAFDLAYELEGSSPRYWDEEAKVALISALQAAGLSTLELEVLSSEANSKS